MFPYNLRPVEFHWMPFVTQAKVFHFWAPKCLFAFLPIYNHFWNQVPKDLAPNQVKIRVKGGTTVEMKIASMTFRHFFLVLEACEAECLLRLDLLETCKSALWFLSWSYVWTEIPPQNISVKQWKSSCQRNSFRTIGSWSDYSRWNWRWLSHITYNRRNRRTFTTFLRQTKSLGFQHFFWTSRRCHPSTSHQSRRRSNDLQRFNKRNIHNPGTGYVGPTQNSHLTEQKQSAITKYDL